MMTLYSGTTDPFSQRCRIVLYEKGMDFQIVDVDLHNKPEDLAVMNPYNQVPVLVERDLVRATGTGTTTGVGSSSSSSSVPGSSAGALEGTATAASAAATPPWAYSVFDSLARSFVRTVTLAPLAAISIAALRPATPLPTTMKSVVSVIVS